MIMRAHRVYRDGVDIGAGITFRVEHLLTREDLIDALAWSVRHDQPTELPAPMSLAKAADTIRDTLHEAGGQNYHYWAEYAPDESATQAWAEEVVDRVFGPTLYGPTQKLAH